jgi:Rrf2 family nitric oxide-sensitive transcriptional repressor
MISKSTEYALRAVICLARSDERLNVGQIAGLTQVPSRYLAKILQRLVHVGLVQSTRGRSGGFALVGQPKDITILEVVSAVDPIKRISCCPLDLPEHKECLCALHQRMDDALASVETAFRNSTLADILVNPGPQWPLGGPERNPRSGA